MPRRHRRPAAALPSVPAGAELRPTRPANPMQAPAPVRAMLVGPSTTPLASTVSPVADDGRALLADDGHGPRTVDVLVLGADAPSHRVPSLEDEAAAAGIPLLRPGPSVTVEMRGMNPIGWRRETREQLGVYLADPHRSEAWRAVTDIARHVDHNRLVVLVPDACSTPVRAEGLTVRAVPATDPPALSRELHTYRGLIDHPLAHASTEARATWLVALAARGIPVIPTTTEGLAPGVSEPLEHAFRNALLDDLDDADRREQLSLRLRRITRRHHAPHEVWGRFAAETGFRWPKQPTVSVLLASNRPNLVEDAVRRIARQSYPELEIIVALHGDGFADDLVERLHSLTERPLETLRVEADVPLGEVLNLATSVAGGDLIAKMDDDDLYDVDHLVDLVEALRYSDATIVGKGSEFVYLSELDVTIRRFTNGAESGNRNVAGGTLLLGRDALLSAGKWQRARRSVDQRLIDDILHIGGRLHRTHGHGFVLMRTESGHTWDTSVDYFLQQATQQWRGLALQVAGVS